MEATNNNYTEHTVSQKTIKSWAIQLYKCLQTKKETKAGLGFKLKLYGTSVDVINKD